MFTILSLISIFIVINNKKEYYRDCKHWGAALGSEANSGSLCVHSSPAFNKPTLKMNFYNTHTHTTKWS